MLGLVQRRRGLYGAIAVSLVFSSHLAVADEKEEVLITASRFTQPIDDALWSANVLTRVDIEALQPRSVQDLLWGLAGIDVDNSGGLGKVTSVFMRGTEGDHTLLLIDGVRVGSATIGLPPYELIPVDQIERIEVVRGPRSTLYGSEAVGGVIQIITRGGERRGLSIDGSVTGASNDTRRISANVQGGGGRAWFSLGGEMLETDGINSCLGSLSPPGGCFTDESDRDGLRSNSGSLTAGYRFSDRLSVELRSLIADGRTEYDGSFSNEIEFQERVASLSVDASLSEAWQARLMVGRNDDKQLNLLNGTPGNRFDTQRDNVSVQIDGSLSSRLRLIAGADYTDDNVDSTTAYDVSSRSTTGIFSELHGTFGKWAGLLGARYEDNEQFGGHTTGSVGASWSPDDRHRLTATWGTAFRAPSFNELYFPGFGNPNLSPEESESIEIGIAGNEGAFRWALNAYQTDVDDLILFDVRTSDSQNIASSRIRGIELQAQWRSDLWNVSGQVTRMSPINTSPGANDGKLLPRRAKVSASVDVRRRWLSGSAGVVARWQGQRYNDLGNFDRLGGYFTADVTLEQALGQTWTLQARVANLFDRDYQTALFYPQDGRNYGVTVRYRFAAE